MVKLDRNIKKKDILHIELSKKNLYCISINDFRIMDG